uniref:Uncharacterized protein n=1 Tax=Streptomyces avermitilis TaxID=33903 RepID=A0A499VFW6_STRAX|nr:hypothetical protein SAVMC3_60140 [Streptomyces avermitilis]
MDNDVSAGSTTTVVGRLTLGITLLAFGLGYADVIDGVTAADAVSVAHYVGGVALFVAGLLALRERDAASGTAFSALGALWFTWAVTAGSRMSDNAAGLFLLLFALVALSLTLGRRAASSTRAPTACSPSRSCCWPSRTSRATTVSAGSAAGSRWPRARSPGTRRRRPWPTGPPPSPDALPAGGDGRRLTAAGRGWAPRPLWERVPVRLVTRTGTRSYCCRR